MLRREKTVPKISLASSAAVVALVRLVAVGGRAVEEDGAVEDEVVGGSGCAGSHFLL
jgi:hypothetical protein